jgi:nucleoside-diphosphate-sugar epimerase
MIIALTGASGFIGQHLLEHLATDKKRDPSLQINVLIHRATPESTLPNVTYTRGDLFEPESLLPLLHEGCVAVNLAYLSAGSEADNLLAAENFIAACRQKKVRRIIHCSTAVVTGESSTDVINESTQAQPRTSYELTKYKIERLFLDKASEFCEVIILRPTAVFGAGGKNLLKLANDLKSGNPVLNYLKSSLFGKRQMNLVGIDNVVAALSLLLFSDKELNRETFLISDDEFPMNNFVDVESFLLQKLGQKKRPRVAIPEFALRFLLKIAGKTQTPRLRYDSSKIISFGLQKPRSLDQSLEQFARWYLSRENS